MADMCVRCLNNSTCRVITNLQSNVSSIHCACLQGWLGDRCQVRVRLLLVSVSMTTATLQWETQTADSGNSYTDNQFVSNLEIVPNFTNVEKGVNDQEGTETDLESSLSGRSEAFSFQTQIEMNVNYWTNNQRSVCNIIPNLTRTVFTISGLDRGTEYTFCAKTDNSFTCDFDLVSHFDDVAPACVSVATKADDTSIPKTYLISVSCVAILGLIILFVVVIISKKNDYFSFLVCAKEDKRPRGNRSAIQGSAVRAALADDSRSDIYLLKSPTANQTISISPPNCPGKPKYKIKKRLRGYAAFSAQNEQTIPLSTVLEYSERDIDDEFDESDNDSDVHGGLENDTNADRTEHQMTNAL